MQWLTENWIWLVFAIGIFLLMRQGGMGCGMGIHPNHRHHDLDTDDKSDSPVDPVSGEHVQANQALNTQYHGRTYYFASSANREAFQANPDRYLPRHGGHGCC